MRWFLSKKSNIPRASCCSGPTKQLIPICLATGEIVLQGKEEKFSSYSFYQNRTTENQYGNWIIHLFSLTNWFTKEFKEMIIGLFFFFKLTPNTASLYAWNKHINSGLVSLPSKDGMVCSSSLKEATMNVKRNYVQ